MEEEKPFKTIEVVDSQTNQTCKIACMSCIRGHRTTMCGIPVCRTKVFWTVKRPGRPSNSCTCRYGASGGCKCVVAKSACPHKPKKGEKRSRECRCDEQGRYCCVLDPDHWTSLLSLRKPTVDFFPTKEALEAKQVALPAQSALLSTPDFTSLSSPPTRYLVPDSPLSSGRPRLLHIQPDNRNGHRSESSTTLTPRFGLMGVGAPMGSHFHVSPDALTWEGQAPLAPGVYSSHQAYERSEQESYCQAPSPTAQTVRLSTPQTEHYLPQINSALSSLDRYDDIPDPVSVPQLPSQTQQHSTFDFDKLQADYFKYQFPSAICQNCGLSGCTCRNCPPVFQNFGTTSWAQCCGRKHARDVHLAPAPKKVARTNETFYATTERHTSSSRGELSHPETWAETQSFDAGDDVPPRDLHHLDLLPPSASADLHDFDINPQIMDLLPPGVEPLDLNEFLLPDLDRSRAPDCGDSGGGTGAVGGGGCCCGNS